MRVLFLTFEKLYFNTKINYVCGQLFHQNFINIQNCLQLKWCHIFQNVNRRDFERGRVINFFFHIAYWRMNNAPPPLPNFHSLFRTMCESATQWEVADGIKMAKLLALKLGHYLRLGRVVRRNHKGP